MTQEEKSLLLQDLCARLPYGVYIEHTTTGTRGKLTNIAFQHKYNNTDYIQDIDAWIRFFGYDEYVDATYFRPMLRPTSSMTEEEYEDFKQLDRRSMHRCRVLDGRDLWFDKYEIIDWFNVHHFDYRGLIEKGLAIDCTGLNIY